MSTQAQPGRWQFWIGRGGTEKLMVEFYRGICDKSPRTALREAQLAVLRMEAYSHPFFWSPFTLVGDWR